MASSPIFPAPGPAGGGLVSQADPGPASAPDAGTAGSAQGQPLNPGQQQAYDLVVQQALGFLLDDNHARLLVQKAQAGDPRQVIADAMGPLLQQIYGAAKQAGVQVDMVTLLAAGINVITVLAQMLSVAGVIQEVDIPAFCREVAQQAVQQHNASVPQQTGATDPAAGGGPALAADTMQGGL